MFSIKISSYNSRHKIPVAENKPKESKKQAEKIPPALLRTFWKILTIKIPNKKFSFFKGGRAQLDARKNSAFLNFCKTTQGLHFFEKNPFATSFETYMYQLCLAVPVVQPHLTGLKSDLFVSPKNWPKKTF